MKNLRTLVISFIALMIGAGSCELRAQPAASDQDRRFIDLTLGLGIDLHSCNSVTNYINLVAQPALNQRLTNPVSAVEFFAVPEVQVSHQWSTGLEYSLLIKSYNVDAASGYSRSNYSYQVHLPTLLVHYLVLGEGYRLKFGGGIGYHFVTFFQDFPTIGTSETLKSEGPGLKIDAVGNTKFDETFYGSIGVDARWDLLGTLKRTGPTAQVARSTAALPELNFFTVGVKFGITFQVYQ